MPAAEPFQPGLEGMPPVTLDPDDEPVAVERTVPAPDLTAPDEAA